MSTPSLYAPRTMLAALYQLKTVRRFLIDTLFGVTENHLTTAIDIDIVKGARKLAAFVNPRLQAKLVERDGYQSLTYTPSYIKEKMITTADDVLQRLPGEAIYDGGETPESRAAVILTTELRDLSERISRREEWMAAKALIGGTIVCKGDGVNQTIDFLMPSDHLITYTSTAKWTDTANSTPLTNLRTSKALIQKHSGLNANIAIMTPATAEYFVANKKQISGVDGLMNQRMIDIGRIVPTELPNGVTYYGRINSVGLDIYGYEEWYVDPASGNEEQMLPDGKVVIAATNARSILHYAVIQDLGARTNAAVPRYPKSWEENDPSARILMLQSAPLPALHQPDAVVCLTVY